MPVITLNVNGLNTLIKDRSSEQIFKKRFSYITVYRKTISGIMT